VVNAGDAAAVPEVLSKGAFARLINVSPARVSQYISEGKLKADALDGAGRDAKIRVRTACQQLKRSLDVGQMVGNGLTTRLDVPAPADAHVLPFQSPATAPDTIEEQIKRERLEGIRRDNRKKAEDEAARAGIYTLTDHVRLQMGRVAAEMLATFEGSLGEFASAVAGKWQLPQRDVLHLLRGSFRDVRVRMSAAQRQKGSALPELVEHDPPDVAPEAKAEE
jgi:hypothetical protein